jgi:hypothetical protein
MKIRYEKWTCAVCDQVKCILEKTEYSYIPYWFHINTTGIMSNKPSFDTFACSVECLKKIGDSVQKRLDDHRCSVPKRKDNQVTICNQCGKLVTTDALNPLFGGRDPLLGWTFRTTPASHFDFCSEQCANDNLAKPEDGIFFGTELSANWQKDFLVEAIEATDFKEAFKIAKNKISKAFRFPKLNNEDLEKFLKACNESQAGIGQELRDDIERTGM